MAVNFTPKLSHVSLLFVTLSITAYLARATSVELLQPRTMQFTIYVTYSGPNANLIPIAGVPGKAWTRDDFGTVFCVDNPITKGPSPYSPEVGRSQGMLVATSLDGSDSVFLFSFCFTDKEYNGSTLQTQATVNRFEPVREVPVVSGTGVFQNARGTATFKMYSSSIFQFNFKIETTT